MEIQVYVDASCREGKSFYGYVIQAEGATLAEGSGYYPSDSNNVAAEHIAADLGYRVAKLLARRFRIEKITLFTDEENLVKDKRRPQVLKVIHHEDGITSSARIPIEYQWIPSKENPADRLVSSPEKLKRAGRRKNDT